MRKGFADKAENSSGKWEVRNRVILSLRPAAQEFLHTRLVTKKLKSGQIIYEDGKPCTHAVFPHDGVISIVAHMDTGRSVEKASIGKEGFLGFGLLAGASNAMGTSIVRVPGYASWLSVEDLKEAREEFICVGEAMLGYAKALIFQLMESVACNSLHSADQRIARLLLHTHDRMADDTFELTQKTISDALGLRRATVGSVCSNLQKNGAIRYTRGDLKITDRKKLEKASCECYQRIRAASL